MKEFLNALKCGLIFQVICWGSFILFDENGIIDVGFAMIFGIITLVGVLIFYFMKTDKYLKKNNFNSWIFNITLFIFWILSSIGMTSLLIDMVSKGYLHVCSGEGWDCFLNGIEYFFYGFLMAILAGLIVVIKLIIWIYKLIKKKISK